ncbi:MAG TPA: hypothetical protein ENO00_06390 [Deltaproteobacteria bacterium]|nr:hypothetical protein [Deltaproteobacteria bacterium]
MPTKTKEPVPGSTNKYISFIDAALDAVKASRIPLYSSRFSKKTYNQHQLMVIILFKDYLREDYRDTVELLAIMDSVREKQDLNTVPHYTTLHKVHHENQLHYLQQNPQQGDCRVILVGG